MKLSEILSWFDEIAPFRNQESYDNSGLQTGNPAQEIHSALICLDVTEEVLKEAQNMDSDLIISHHPLIFKGINSLTGETSSERILIDAIRNDIAILSVHTNIDTIYQGVNAKICSKLELTGMKILEPFKDKLVKLVVFVPADHADHVRRCIFDAGAGVIGEYDMCSFNLEGTGTFRGSESSNPYTGVRGEIHHEKEVRIETIMPEIITKRVIAAMLKVHPYEEVAYDLYPLRNEYPRSGSGMTGYLPEPEDEMIFLEKVKKIFRCRCIRHTNLLGRKIRKVAVCGGSGSGLLGKAVLSGADIFISADFRYHQFFEAENRILIADIGHYESEQFTKEYICELLEQKFPTFAVHLSEINTNPINYL